MEWPRNAWYVALYGHDLVQGDVVSRRILDTPVALFRTAAGEAVALQDRCPHRAVPLSMGRVCDGDQLACAYHGLRFGADGRCTFNPHGSGARPAALQVPSFPAIERYGMVWLWMGDAPPDLAMIPDLPLLLSDPRYSISHPAWLRMNAPADLVIDNLLDLSHASFLHDGILGNATMVDADPPKVVVDSDRVSVLRSFGCTHLPPYFDTIFKGDGEPAALWNHAHWQAPSSVVIDNGVHEEALDAQDGAHSYSLHALTPETPTTTLYHMASALRLLPQRKPEEDEIIAALGKLRRVAFCEQDDPIVQAQFAAMVEAGADFHPALLTIDVGPVRWRRVLASLNKTRGGAMWTPVDGRVRAIA